MKLNKNIKKFISEEKVDSDEIIFRKLNNKDINQIVVARIAQETENGIEINEDYVLEYKKVIRELLDENNIIGFGAFKNDILISLAFYNFIYNDNVKKTPYLCGVWTHPNERNKKISSIVNEKLLKYILENNMEYNNSMLTVEGDIAANNLYKKLGYENVNNEMEFLGDVKRIDNIYVEKYKNERILKNIYRINEKNKIRISYIQNQLFPHPNNINGKVARILEIEFIDENINIKEFRSCLQKFFSENRFCKFNIEKILNREPKIWEVFNLKNKNLNSIIKLIESLEFEGYNGEKLSIRLNKNFMLKNFNKEKERIR